MKCFYHTEADAVGTCRQCQKTACRSCIEDFGGVLLCISCAELLKRQQAEEAYQQQRRAEAEKIVRRQRSALMQQAAEQNRETKIRKAQNKIFWSWIVGGAFAALSLLIGFVGMIGALMSKNTEASSPLQIFVGTLFATLIYGYTTWAIFWGIPVVWRWTKGVTDSFIANLLFWGLCSIPLGVAILYGVFGGGIYQFLEHRKIAAGQF